jgi:large-conductance mechanosensitive channel
MARKKKVKTSKSKSKKSMHKGHIMPLAIGAIVGNIANNIIVKFGSSIPMISAISPLAIGVLANYMKSDYSN